LHNKRLARVDLVGYEARDMAVAAMLTDRTEGLPELEVGNARISESGVRRS
jgi:indole-3-glycerol phosphate synthase